MEVKINMTYILLNIFLLLPCKFSGTTFLGNITEGLAT